MFQRDVFCIIPRETRYDWFILKIENHVLRVFICVYFPCQHEVLPVPQYGSGEELTQDFVLPRVYQHQGNRTVRVPFSILSTDEV